MISATDALKLYEESGKELETHLKTIEGEITTAAKGGEKFVNYHVGCIPEYREPLPTPLQSLVIMKLRELGFRVTFGKYGDSYVPRALTDDDGNGPKHRNYGITVGW